VWLARFALASLKMHKISLRSVQVGTIVPSGDMKVIAIHKEEEEGKPHAVVLHVATKTECKIYFENVHDAYTSEMQVSERSERALRKKFH